MTNKDDLNIVVALKSLIASADNEILPIATNMVDCFIRSINRGESNQTALTSGLKFFDGVPSLVTAIEDNYKPC